jgi:hypothetical protein
MATTTTISAIAAQFNAVESQMDKCTHCTDGQGQHYYIVESQSEAGVEYHVKYNRQFGKLTCTCKAGQQGTTCWHKRASLASEAAFRATRLARRQAEQAEIEATPQYRAERFEIARLEMEALHEELVASQR